MTTAWSAFYPNIVPDLPGAPLDMVEHHVREIVRDFCERTLFWQETIVLDLEDDTGIYSLIPDPIGDPLATPYVVHRINRVEAVGSESDKPLDPTTEAELDEKIEVGWRQIKGPPKYYYRQTPNLLRLVYRPDNHVDDGLSIYVAVKPTVNAVELLNDDILEHYRNDIAYGVKGRMMLSPKKPYTDAQMGKENERKYNAAVGAAATHRARDYTRRPARVRGYDR